MSVDAYLDARAKFEALGAETQKLARDLALVAQELELRPGTFYFSNVGVGLPPDALLVPQSHGFDGNNWPSAKQIMQHLSDWHAAKTAMENAWSAIPADRQAGLKPPPSRRGPGLGR